MLQTAFCLLLVWLVWFWGLHVERSTYFLDRVDQQRLAGYAAQAEQAWAKEGAAGVERWRQQFQAAHHTWAAVIGRHLQSLGTTALSAEESSHLTFMRKLDWPMSRRLDDELPYVSIAFTQHPDQGRVVLQLPQPLLPAGLTPWTHALTHGVVPALLALLVGVLLYRHLVVPLNDLRERANALRADDLDSLQGSVVARRRDELGELAQAYEHMAERVRQGIRQQRQLLRTLSHEMRTPLARLRVASESDLAQGQLRSRVTREVDDMQRLVDDALDLAWLDTERPRLECEAIRLDSIWEALIEDLQFETRWPAHRLCCELPEGCVVHAHLNSLAQALENLLRNAVRHSPNDGVVTLSAKAEGDYWLVWLDDQGGGVADTDLERIFEPFLRLDGTPGKGFGLGLSIARRSIELQGGHLWASRRPEGLRMNMRLRAAEERCV